MKKFLYGIITVIVLIIVMASCGNAEDTASKVEDSGETKSTTSAPKEEPKKEENLNDKIYNVGDTVGLTNGMEYTIVSAEHVNGNEYIQPEKGQVLKLHIKAVNNGTQSEMVYSGNFNLYDANGSQFKEYFGEGSPISGDINKGKQLEGDIWYDVDGSGKYELILKPNTYDKLEIKFNIQL